MRPLCSRTSCSKSKGGVPAWLFIAASASAGRCSTRLQRLNDRSWPKCHFGPMARDLSLTGTATLVGLLLAAIVGGVLILMIGCRVDACINL
jgi:hypothetical protein